jgi:vacuolar-type H+-ATPase subunit E/Vma4
MNLMLTEAQKRAKEKYRKKGKQVVIQFYQTEKDMIAHLEKQPQKATYIKDLIRADMKKAGV